MAPDALLLIDSTRKTEELRRYKSIIIIFIIIYMSGNPCPQSLICKAKMWTNIEHWFDCTILLVLSRLLIVNKKNIKFKTGLACGLGGGKWAENNRNFVKTIFLKSWDDSDQIVIGCPLIEDWFCQPT